MPLVNKFICLPFCLLTTSIAMANDFNAEKCLPGDPLCVEEEFVQKNTVVPTKKQIKSAKPTASKIKTKDITVHREKVSQKIVDVLPSTPPEVKKIGPDNSKFDRNYVKTANGWELSFDESDTVDGKTLTREDFINGNASRTKIIMSADLECQLPKEVTDRYGFDRSKCKAPPTKKVNKAAQDFNQNYECPKDLASIEELKKIQAKYEKSPYEVEIGDLIVYPINPASSSTEAHLPVACGYHSYFKKWLKVSFFCTTDQECFNQSAKDYTKDNTKFLKYSNVVNLSKMVYDKQGDVSYREGGRSGDLRIIPLGNGVFIQTYRHGDDDIYFYGLVLVPKIEELDKLACRKKYELEEAKYPVIANALQEEVQLIQKKITALSEVQAITKTLYEKKSLSEEQRQKLKERAIGLEKIVNGKESDVQVEPAKLSCVEDNPTDLANVNDSDRSLEKDLDSGDRDKFLKEAMDWAVGTEKQ